MAIGKQKRKFSRSIAMSPSRRPEHELAKQQPQQPSPLRGEIGRQAERLSDASKGERPAGKLQELGLELERGELGAGRQARWERNRIS